MKNDSSTTQNSLFLTTIISMSIPPLLLFLYPISGGFTISFFAISIVEIMNIGQPADVEIAVSLMRTLGTVCGIGFVGEENL